MKIECEGVSSCWLIYYKKSASYKIVFVEKPSGLVLNGRHVEFRVFPTRAGTYAISCYLPHVFFTDILKDISDTAYNQFPDANRYLSTVVEIMKKTVPSFPVVQVTP